MRPADDLPPAHLVGKRVAFKDDAAHAGCWHHSVGLKAGKVLRVARTLAQKLQMMEEGGLEIARVPDVEEAEPRIWVKADPCPSHPRGCEVAVDKECLLVDET